MHCKGKYKLKIRYYFRLTDRDKREKNHNTRFIDDLVTGWKEQNRKCLLYVYAAVSGRCRGLDVNRRKCPCTQFQQRAVNILRSFLIKQKQKNADYMEFSSTNC